jgi:putative tryptophan/tyrosine transport system substrate-binding protein
VARLRAYAAELVGLAPDVILASNSSTLQALVQRTHTIPIVFYDPVSDGFVASLARPGGNVTGFANNEFSMSGKWLELLKDVAPGVNRAMVILDPRTQPGADISAPSRLLRPHLRCRSPRRP